MKSRAETEITYNEIEIVSHPSSAVVMVVLPLALNVADINSLKGHKASLLLGFKT